MTATTTRAASQVPAGAAAIAASVAIDATLAMLALVAGVALGLALGALGWVLGALLVVGAAAAWWWARASLAASPGHLAMGLRTVDGLTDLPASPLRQGRRTLDVRRGAHPLHVVARPAELAAATATGLASPAVAGLALVLDDGSRHVVRQRTVVGRDPSPAAVPGVDARVAIPDLSRSIARAHLVVEVDGDDVVVTDLGDATGTRVVDGDREHPLVPGEPARVAFGTVLRLGTRTIALRRRTDLAGAA